MSGVLRTIDPQPPLHPASVSSPQGGEGVGGHYFGIRQTLDWPLIPLQSIDLHKINL